MKFQLVGTVRWAVGSCHDDRSKDIHEEFDAPNEKAAIEKAKEIVQKYHEEHSHLTDYGLQATLQVVKPIWETSFYDEEEAVAAQPARPAVKAHFEEKALK